jgi:Biopolymer transport protein
MGMNVPSNRRGGRRAPMAEINVTPFVDVMLVLLIIFMVTAPLLVTGVPVRLPESRASALEADKKPTIVSIDPGGTVFVNDDPVSDDALPDRLNALRAGLTQEEQVFLRADAALDYGRVMRVMGELNRAGLDRVALVTTGVGMGGSSPSIARSANDE